MYWILHNLINDDVTLNQVMNQSSNDKIELTELRQYWDN